MYLCIIISMISEPHLMYAEEGNSEAVYRVILYCIVLLLYFYNMYAPVAGI